ncbi:MAG: amino acid permease [Acidimicrobiales bacterium]|nr:amino acid permease [Acidimicrobiales bacterium]RZV46947.1 MAG: amino acid permease [Acidimicrobiales bacterium]
MHEGAAPKLDRTLSLPLLVFYGLGVTVGAGIFALVGEIIGVAGINAPLSFLLAGTIAGFTGVSYMFLVREFPRAGGEAVYVRRGIGDVAGQVAGIGVIATAIVSSAAISLAFAGYVASLVDIPEKLTATLLVAVLCLVALAGVRESVVLAAVITVLEVGTLIIVAVLGLDLVTFDGIANAFSPAGTDLSAVLTGSGIAFFAFIGFEDVANMAEETVDPRRTAPRAILITLIATVIIYVLLAIIAVSVPDPGAIADSSAPMSTLFEAVTGRGGSSISTIASFAMLNGVLVQVVVASRVLYGMAADGQLHHWLAVIEPERQTPVRATLLVAGAIAVLAVLFPLVELARITSIITLAVFTAVNVALVRLARSGALRIGRWWLNGVIGAIVAAALGVWQFTEVVL